MELTPLSGIRERTLIARHAHHRRHCCFRGCAGMSMCLRWCFRVGWLLDADPLHERSLHGHGWSLHVRNGRRHPYFASADRCRRWPQLWTLSACQPMRQQNQPRRFHHRTSHFPLFVRRQWDPALPADAGESTAEWAPRAAESAWYRRSLRADPAR